MAFNPKDIQFNVKVTGEVSNEEYAGLFKMRPILPHALQLEQDRLRREYLGGMADSASPRAANQASIFAYLAVRVTEAPSWWKDSNNGFALYDDNVVGAVYNTALAKVEEYLSGLQKKAETAKKELEALGSGE
jgi:hypothetical protein